MFTWATVTSLNRDRADDRFPSLSLWWGYDSEISAYIYGWTAGAQDFGGPAPAAPVPPVARRSKPLLEGGRYSLIAIA